MTQSANQARNAELASFRARAALATKTVHDKQAEEKEEPKGQADHWQGDDDGPGSLAEVTNAEAGAYEHCEKADN
jgi:hypothetical protein